MITACLLRVGGSSSNLSLRVERHFDQEVLKSKKKLHFDLYESVLLKARRSKAKSTSALQQEHVARCSWIQGGQIWRRRQPLRILLSPQKCHIWIKEPSIDLHSIWYQLNISEPWLESEIVTHEYIYIYIVCTGCPRQDLLKMLEEVCPHILVWISAIYFSTLCTLLVATKLPLQSNWLLWTSWRLDEEVCADSCQHLEAVEARGAIHLCRSLFWETSYHYHSLGSSQPRPACLCPGFILTSRTLLWARLIQVQVIQVSSVSETFTNWQDGNPVSTKAIASGVRKTTRWCSDAYLLQCFSTLFTSSFSSCV